VNSDAIFAASRATQQVNETVLMFSDIFIPLRPSYGRGAKAKDIPTGPLRRQHPCLAASARHPAAVRHVTLEPACACVHLSRGPEDYQILRVDCYHPASSSADASCRVGGAGAIWYARGCTSGYRAAGDAGAARAAAVVRGVIGRACTPRTKEMSVWRLLPERGSLQSMAMSSNPYCWMTSRLSSATPERTLNHSPSLPEVELILAAPGSAVIYGSIRA